MRRVKVLFLVDIMQIATALEWEMGDMITRK